MAEAVICYSVTRHVHIWSERVRYTQIYLYACICIHTHTYIFIYI